MLCLHTDTLGSSIGHHSRIWGPAPASSCFGGRTFRHSLGPCLAHAGLSRQSKQVRALPNVPDPDCTHSPPTPLSSMEVVWTETEQGVDLSQPGLVRSLIGGPSLVLAGLPAGLSYTFRLTVTGRRGCEHSCLLLISSQNHSPTACPPSQSDLCTSRGRRVAAISWFHRLEHRFSRQSR